MFHAGFAVWRACDAVSQLWTGLCQWTRGTCSNDLSLSSAHRNSGRERQAAAAEAGAGADSAAGRLSQADSRRQGRGACLGLQGAWPPLACCGRPGSWHGCFRWHSAWGAHSMCLGATCSRPNVSRLPCCSLVEQHKWSSVCHHAEAAAQADAQPGPASEALEAARSLQPAVTRQNQYSWEASSGRASG